MLTLLTLVNLVMLPEKSTYIPTYIQYDMHVPTYSL